MSLLPCGDQSHLCVDIIVSYPVTKVGGANTGGYAVRLQGGRLALGLRLHRVVNVPQQHAGGEALSDHRPLCGGLLPRIVETGLTLSASLHLLGVPGVESLTVRGLGGEERPAGPAPHSPAGDIRDQDSIH